MDRATRGPWIFLLSVVALGLVLLAQAPALAVTYYVRTSGLDSNAGTSPAAAFLTIKKAGDTAHAGDTIYVGAGVYSSADVGPNNNGTSGSPILCIADTTGAYTGDAGTVEFQKQFNLAKDYWTIIGFKVSNDTGKAGIYVNGCLGIVVQNCMLTGRLNGVLIVSTSTVTISNCTITSSADNGIDISGSNTATLAVSNCTLTSNAKAGLYAKKPTVTVKNCLITNNTQQGIWADNDSATNVTIWNSTISDNTQDGLKVSGGTTIINNSAVTYNGAYGLNKAGGTLNNSYNDVYSNTSGNYRNITAGTGAISSDPLYTNRAGGDYTFANTSPLLDSGTNAAGTVDDDLRGRVRPINAGWDMGCYEQAPAGTLLLVATSTTAPTSQETARRTLIQSWGYYAQLIDDDDTQGNYNTAASSAVVCYVPRDITAASLSTKLAGVYLGVVNEQPSLADEFGFASGTSAGSATAINISNGTHYITSPLGTGSVTLFSSSQPTVTLTGTKTKEILRLTTASSAGSLSLLEAGSVRYDSGSVVGRRAQLPWGGSSFDVNALASNGQTLMKRTIQWAGGIVGHWTLDETSGTTATDSSGLGNTGTLTGGITFSSNSVSPAKLVNGLDFNGTSHYISVANASSLQLTTALTITAWVKGDAWSSGSNVNTVLRKGTSDPTNYQLAVKDGKVTLFLDASDTAGISGNTVLSTNKWYHVAATWDGTTAKIYVNGTLDNGTGTARSGTIGTDARSLYMGGYSGSDYFDGKLDDVRLLNYAADLTEIKNIKATGLPRSVRVVTWVEIP